MISIFDVLIILFVHWVGDFVLQTDWEARNKSKNNVALTHHVLTYSTTVSIFVGFLLRFNGLPSMDAMTLTFMFWVATVFCHWITDYFTSRINAKLLEQKNFHTFFICIGADQFLHFAQLLGTFYLLRKL